MFIIFAIGMLLIFIMSVIRFKLMIRVYVYYRCYMFCLLPTLLATLNLNSIEILILIHNYLSIKCYTKLNNNVYSALLKLILTANNLKDVVSFD